MAINLPKETVYDVNAEHHVISYEYENDINKVHVRVQSWKTAGAFNNNKRILADNTYTFAFGNLPVAIRSALNDGKVAIEELLITMPDYLNGVRVRDNGNPL